MAQKYVTDKGTLIIPGAYATYEVKADAGGLAASGVVVLMGESDAGPHFSAETDLKLNIFGPDQTGEVINKYGSGNLVDAFLAAAVPANDEEITGAPTGMILVKTNDPSKAISELLKGGSPYATLADRAFGSRGNLISYEIEEESFESPPSATFAWIPPAEDIVFSVYSNGAELIAPAIGSQPNPTQLVAALDVPNELSASGGAAVTVVEVIAGPNEDLLDLVADGDNITLSYADTTAAAKSWIATPPVGGTLVISVTSSVAGAGGENVGGYQITSVSASSLVARKLSDFGAAVPAAGVVTAPVNDTGTVTHATTDVVTYNTISIAQIDPWVGGVTAPIEGLGKSLELAEVADDDLFSRYVYGTSGVRVSWVSTSASPQVLTSSSERQVKMTVRRHTDNVEEEFVAGGPIGLRIGYVSDGATCTVNSTHLITAGTANNLSISLKDFPTLSDLAAFIDSKAGYSCRPGNATIGFKAPAVLDLLTDIAIGSENGALTGRIKMDAYDFATKVNTESSLVQLGETEYERADTGLPGIVGVTYLEGGAKGSTLAADIVAAFAAIEKVRANFIVPLFSRDAEEDILDGLTEDSSTYTIGAIHALARTHVLAMSTLKRSRPRQAFLSKSGIFNDQREAGANLASPRCSMAFKDILRIGTDGAIHQYQPWMGGVVAAGMQAAGFYRAIVHKSPNITGAVHADGSYDMETDSHVESALESGLLPIGQREDGSWYWVSDQTTYGRDANPIFNSIQAIYASDLVAMSAKERMERKYLGRSQADVTAAGARLFLAQILDDMVRLKLLAASDDAPAGYRNISIRISGPVMLISAEVKVAGAIYFIPINFTVSTVQQAA